MWGIMDKGLVDEFKQLKNRLEDLQDGLVENGRDAVAYTETRTKF